MKRAILAALTALVATAAVAQAMPAPHHHHHHSSGVAWSGETWHIAGGTNGAGQRNCPDHVSFSGGHAFILVANLCGGGLGGSLNTTSGTFAVTFRDTGSGGKYAIGLWPQNGSRPEVDFAEDNPNDPTRDHTNGTYHPGAGCQGCIHSKVSGDFTQWHTMSVTRDASGFTLKMDGTPWASYASGYQGAMHVFIHNEAWGSSGTSTLEVASVTAS